MAEVHGNRIDQPARHRRTGFEVQNSRFSNIPSYHVIGSIINELMAI